jgi:phosphatidylglycerophosphate synthase
MPPPKDPLTPTISPEPAIVVLLPGPDARVLGTSVRARNARVAQRVRATLATPTELVNHGDTITLVVPSHVLIDTPLFERDAAAHDGSLVAVDGALVGRARDIARHLAAPRATPPIPRRQAPPGAIFDVSSTRGQHLAAGAILLRTGKPTDGWVSRRLNRPISRRISHLLLGWGFAASHASAITLAVGILAAAVATVPGHVPFALTGLLFHLASVLDGVDGEMARATLTESPSGARLDTVVDQLTYVACFIGVMIGWGREADPASAWFLGAAAAVLLGLGLWRGARFVARYASNGSFVFVDRSVRRAAELPGRRGLRVASTLFTLLRRDLFALIFLVVSLTGTRALVPWLVIVGALVAHTTFVLYPRELAHAAVALARKPL